MKNEVIAKYKSLYRQSPKNLVTKFTVEEILKVRERKSTTSVTNDQRNPFQNIRYQYE